MKAFLNGNLVPEEQAVVSVLDRGFLYGDGLFETLRFYSGRPFRWKEHLRRLEEGARFLGIRVPYDPKALLHFADRMLKENGMPDAIVRVTLSRGRGPRGYSPKAADSPTLCMTAHPAPDKAHSEPPGWRLITASFRLAADDPISVFKTCSKLTQVLARSEADQAGAEEALLLNTNGDVVEAAASNLFWLSEGRVCTAPLASGVLQGVTRGATIEIARKLGLAVEELAVKPQVLLRCSGVFLTSSVIGIAAGLTLNDAPLKQDPIVERLARAYGVLVEAETLRP